MSEEEDPIEAVSAGGVLLIGGPGPYVIEGKTNSGKSFLLDHIVTHAKHRGLVFSNVITYSGSQAENDSLNFIETLYDPMQWTITKKLEEIRYLITVRKDHIAMMRKLPDGENEAKRFKRENPLLIILDDFGGMMNLTTNVKNPWYTIVTTLRNMGIYMIMLIQYPKQIGPSFWNQCRAILSFDRTTDGLKYYSRTSGMPLAKDAIDKILLWLKTRHRYLVWFMDWTLINELPSTPWLADPVTTGTCPVFHSLEELYNEFE